MREFELTIDEALKKGLAPKEMIPTNSQFLSECIGFRCGAFGLEPALIGENKLVGYVPLEYSWPFPQLLEGEKYNILVVRDTFNMVDRVYSISDNLETINLIFEVDELTFGKGSLMELADFGKYAIMVNGVIAIYWNPVSITGWSHTTGSPEIPMMRTICNFKGQAVGGNITSSWYDCDKSFYIWSKIGQLNFELDQSNEVGYRRDPYGGEVFHVRRLGNSILGYSSNGIVQMSPVDSPTATFAFLEILDKGLINRGAVNGNLHEHVFVDKNYELWRITSEGPQRLGYRKFMESLYDEDIIVLYDKLKSDYYIGNSKKTFLLTHNGLTEVLQHPSVLHRRRTDQSLIIAPDTIDDIDPVISTEAFDMTYRGLKTIFTMETDAILQTGPEAAVDYAYDLTDWKSSSFVPFNNLGIASIIVSGNLFRFKLRFNSLSCNSRISYIRTRYKMTDLRGIRGVYAPPPRGQ
jgi:hypothetical protein